MPQPHFSVITASLWARGSHPPSATTERYPFYEDLPDDSEKYLATHAGAASSLQSWDRGLYSARTDSFWDERRLKRRFSHESNTFTPRVLPESSYYYDLRREGAAGSGGRTGSSETRFARCPASGNAAPHAGRAALLPADSQLPAAPTLYCPGPCPARRPITRLPSALTPGLPKGAFVVSARRCSS